MKQFLSFVRKEFCHILRDRRSMIILLGMPVVLVVLFGFALTNEVKNARVAVLDPAPDAATTALVARLDASRYFEVVGQLQAYRQVEEAFRKGHIKMALVLPQNFARDLRHLNQAQVQLLVDASDTNLANTLVYYASAIIQDYQDGLTGGSHLPYTIRTELRMLYNPQLKCAFIFVPGTIAMVLFLVCTMMTAITIVREKENGTMEVLLVSPVQPFKIVLAKVVPYLVISALNIASILVLGVLVLQVPIKGSLALLVLESLLFTLTSLVMGLFISTVTHSLLTAIFLAIIGMILPNVLLFGFILPIENMPRILQLLSNALPAKWFYQIVSAVMIKGSGLAAVWKQTLVLLGMMLLLLGLSIRLFRVRLA